MAALRIERQIDAPIEEVFARASNFADADKAISAITRIEMLTDGPIGKGTRFRETRLMFGREATEEMEVTEFEQPHRYVLGCDNHGCRYRSELSFAENRDGTLLAMSFEALPLTFFAKVMSVLMKPMMKSMGKMMARDMDDLKSAIEKREEG